MRWMGVLVAIALAGCPGPRRPTPAPPGARVVVISIDGLMPESYLDPDAHGLAVPTLRALRDRGQRALVTPVLPTQTYPVHTTLVTGVAPAVHGITSNRAPDGLAKNQDGYRWYAEDIRVPTLWDAVEAQGGAAALVMWPVTVGADVTWLVPEYWRAGTADDQKLVRALSTPGLLDAVARDTPDLWEHLVPPDVHDEAPFAIARHLLTHERVDLMMVHGWALDDAEHAHGPWSEPALAATERAAALLGELLAVIDLDRTIVVVLSDHGFAPVHTQIRLNVVFADRGLITLDADGKPTTARVTLAATGGTAYLYLDDPDARAEVDAALAAAGDVIAAVHGRDEIARLGGDPRADYLLVAAPGHHISERRTGPVVSPSGGRGDHGMMPDDPAMAASFLAVGPGVTPGDLGTIAAADVAAMLATWLGVDLRSPRR